MTEIMVGEWRVTGQCTICGSPYFSRYRETRPETINSCKCFEHQKHVLNKGKPDSIYNKDGTLKAVYDPHNKGEI